jgi:hypothetical protein
LVLLNKGDINAAASVLLLVNLMEPMLADCTLRHGLNMRTFSGDTLSEQQGVKHNAIHNPGRRCTHHAGSGGVRTVDAK